jgi:hypothetical protein
VGLLIFSLNRSLCQWRQAADPSQYGSEFAADIMLLIPRFFLIWIGAVVLSAIQLAIAESNAADQPPIHMYDAPACRYGRIFHCSPPYF